jgi:hypothetical protein
VRVAVDIASTDHRATSWTWIVGARDACDMIRAVAEKGKPRYTAE